MKRGGLKTSWMATARRWWHTVWLEARKQWCTQGSVIETQGWKGPTRSSSPTVLLSPMLPPKMSGNSFREVMGRSEVSARRGWLPKCARPRLTLLAACAGRKAPPRVPSGRCCSLPSASKSLCHQWKITASRGEAGDKKETNVGSKDRESPPAPRHLQCPATGLGLVGSPWGGADEPSYTRGRGGIKANHSLSARGLRLQSSRFTVPGRKPDLASDCCNHRKMGPRFICLFCT